MLYQLLWSYIFYQELDSKLGFCQYAWLNKNKKNFDRYIWFLSQLFLCKINFNVS